MKIISSVFIVCSLLLASLGIIVWFKNAPSQNNLNTLTVGTAAGYAPFVSVNKQGEYEGFDIDVAQALAQKMGKKLVLKELGSMTSLFMALEQGSIDAIIWALSITQDRLKKVSMINYQGELTTEYPLIFWQKIPSGISTINDMKGMAVCVEPTSAQDTVLNKYPFIIKKSTEKVDDALLNIQYSKADAAFVEPAIAKKFKNKYSEIQIMNVPLAPEDQVQGMGIAIKKNNNALIQQVEQAVNTLKRDGSIKQFEKKWNIT
jgi:ABC-type amino acid transport substrate-binding protein